MNFILFWLVEIYRILLISRYAHLCITNQYESKFLISVWLLEIYEILLFSRLVHMCITCYVTSHSKFD